MINGSDRRIKGYAAYYKKRSKTSPSYGSQEDISNQNDGIDAEENDQSKGKPSITARPAIATKRFDTAEDKRKTAIRRRLQAGKAAVDYK